MDAIQDFEDFLDLLDGRARACWVGLEDLLAIKERIDHPRHREDARVLRKVPERRRSRE